MAKVETSAGIGAIRGRVGGVTFYTRNGQQEMMPAKRQYKIRDKMPQDIRKLTDPLCSAINLEMNAKNNDLLGDADLLETNRRSSKIALCSKDGYLAVKAEGSDIFACAFIHSRGTGQDVSASTQQLCLSDTNLYDYYTSEEAATISFTSYKTRGYRNGPRDNVFLQSGK